MSIPHDYGDGRLHSRGNSRHYIEPDYIASECDDQLPLLSTVGRGPRGAGLTIGNLVNGDGEFSFGIYSDLTGEQVMQTPNLSAGSIAVSHDPEEPVAGETVNMLVHVNQGGHVSHYSVPVPAGAHGSRFYAVSTELEDGGKGHAYSVPVEDLMVYALDRESWDSWPYPRVNDMCVFKASGKIGFGTIEAVEDGNAVFTSQVLFDPLAHVAIGEDGNWEIDGEDTGIAAQGPRGEQGPAGPPGEKGEKGDPDGLPARMTVGSVSEGDEPAFSVHLADETTNTYSINVTLPKGEDGTSINVNGGIYRIADLPPFDDTPVNDAFIVNDYEESEDHRYDLYIRGKEPVIAEEGGPWTVVEDWQGVQGFSTRVLTGYGIDPDTVTRVPKDASGTAFTPHIGILDGDLCTDGKYLGVIGSAKDGSGDYTVTFVARLQIEWDDVLNKPTDLVHQPALDAETEAREQGDRANAEAIASEATARQQKDSELQAAIDALPTTDDLTAALAAEAAEREKQDDLLQDGINAKMQASDIVAGDAIEIESIEDTGQIKINVTVDDLPRYLQAIPMPISWGDDPQNACFGFANSTASMIGPSYNSNGDSSYGALVPGLSNEVDDAVYPYILIDKETLEFDEATRSIKVKTSGSSYAMATDAVAKGYLGY